MFNEQCLLWRELQCVISSSVWWSRAFLSLPTEALSYLPPASSRKKLWFPDGQWSDHAVGLSGRRVSVLAVISTVRRFTVVCNYRGRLRGRCSEIKADVLAYSVVCGSLCLCNYRKWHNNQTKLDQLLLYQHKRFTVCLQGKSYLAAAYRL